MKNFSDYTELENKLMNGIINTWAENGMESSYLDDACESAGITMKVGRGVIGSLIKKGIVLECLPEYSFEISLTKKGDELLDVEYED